MKIPIAHLVQGDLKNIFRDATLVMAIFGPLAIFGVLLCLPMLEGIVLDRLQFDLAVYRPFIVSFLSLIPTMLFGMIFGFIILDERDEDIITFISVTPLQKRGYLSYKLQMPMLLGSGFFFLFIFGTSLIELKPLHVVFIAVLAAMEAAIGTLFLVTFSENKVEGLAFSKLMGIMYLAMPMVFLWDSPWHWLSAWLPPFWVAKAFIHSQSGSDWIWVDLLLGLGVHFGVLLLFLKTFLKRTT